MTGPTDHRTWHANRIQIFKVIVFIVAATIFILAVYTGGFKGEHVHIKLQTADKQTHTDGSSKIFSALNKPKLQPNRTFRTKNNRSIDLDPNHANGVQQAARDETKQIRILCLIMTMEKDLYTKVEAVNKTWAKRCHIHYYVINSKRKRHDFLNIDIADDRKLLIEKMKRAFQFVYENHLNDFDYLLKADDDTYVIIENLQFLMSNYPSNEPGYLGFHFNKFVKTGYMSGGAGYVITNRGLRHLIERGYNKRLCPVLYRAEDKENSEDVETGRCLEFAGVPRLSSLDLDGKETFHSHTLHQHLFDGVPSYVFSWAKNKVRRGKECCSRYSISFHYMTPDAMLYTDHLLYDTTVFGLNHMVRSQKDIFRIETVV